jgi:hypothetical protein
MNDNEFDKKNIMNTTIFNRILISLAVGILLFSNCKEDETNLEDTTPPSQITNITCTPTNGGAVFKYTVPRDEDFLYVRAVYTLDTGEEMFRVSSVFSDSISIEGFGKSTEQVVNLYSVDRNNNWSEPVTMKFTPLKSNPEIVLESITAFPAFSGAIFKWNNELRQKVTIFMIFEAEGKEIQRIISSVEQAGIFNITGLDAVDYNFSVVIKDDFGNETERKSVGTITPIPDFMINKSTWTFLYDELMPDSVIEYTSQLINDELVETTTTVFKADKNGAEGGWSAREAVWESRIQMFWDEIIDDNDYFTMNYYNTGPQSCPFSYYIDLGKTVKMSRVKIWQRDTDEWAILYGNENIKTFELWISDDKITWEFARRATIIKPRSPIDAKNAAEDGHEFIIYEDEPRFTKPFRYLEYRAISPFSAAGENRYGASEITIYGEEL